MFNFIHRLFHAKEKAVDTPHINDRENYLVNNLIRFNSNRFGERFQARKWGQTMNSLYTDVEEAIENFAYACGHHDKDFAQDSLLEVLEYGSKEDIQEVTDEYYEVFRR